MKRRRGEWEKGEGVGEERGVGEGEGDSTSTFIEFSGSKKILITILLSTKIS